MDIGQLLNDTYRILEPLGQGGLGTIYLGYHEHLQKYVVIKRIKDNCADRVNVRAEADILKSLHHRFLPQVYDFIMSEDGIYTVMDYICGYDLKYYMDSGMVLDEAMLIRWMKQLCDVLDYLHTQPQPIYHCDIKPANIMITESGNVCLIDFNVSVDGENNKELTGLSSSYASPEQYRRAMAKMRFGTGDSVPMDGRSDIYSLGAVFYEIVSGVRPNACRENYAPLSMLSHSCSDGLANIIDKMMEENPNRRFKSAKKLFLALKHKEKWESSYRRLRRAGMAADISFWVIGLILICCMIFGYRETVQNRFFEQYEQFAAASEQLLLGDTNEAREVFSLGTEILNTPSYEQVMENHSAQTVDMLLALARTAMTLDDDESAVQLLERALAFDENNGQIYKELAIAYVRQQRFVQAQMALDRASDCGISDAEAALIKASAALAQGDYETARNQALQACGSTEHDVWERAAYIAVRACDALDKNEDCVYFAAQTADKKHGAAKVFWQSIAGEASVKAAADYENVSLRVDSGLSQAVRTGIACLEAAAGSGYASFDDFEHLVCLYEKTESYSQAQKLLGRMMTEFPGEYTVPMQLSYIEYKQENKKAADMRDYSAAAGNLKKAKERCAAAGKDWESDETMVQLEAIFESLRAQGWPV